MPVQPRIREVIDYLDTQRAALADALAAVPAARRDTRPAPDRWSAAEVVEHLQRVEEAVAGLLRAKVMEARAAGLGTESSAEAVVPTVAVERVMDRSRPLTASEMSSPTGALDADAAWARLARTRDELRAWIGEQDGAALGDVVIPHPVLGPQDVYQWLVFIGGHEGRHAGQLREIAASSASA